MCLQLVAVTIKQPPAKHTGKTKELGKNGTSNRHPMVRVLTLSYV